MFWNRWRRSRSDWRPEEVLPKHTNGMLFECLVAGRVTDSWRAYSIGGRFGGGRDESTIEHVDVYSMNHISEILDWCDRAGRDYWEYVEECEGVGIWDYLHTIWDAMCT